MRFMPLLLFPSLLAICGLASAQQVMGGASGAGTQGTAAVAAAASAPVVVDNSGKIVGPLFSKGVVLNINGALVFAPLRRLSVGTTFSSGDLLWDEDHSLTFATTSCSGPPNISADAASGSGLFRPAIIQRQTHVVTIYVAASGDSVPTPFHSAAFGNAGFGNGPVCQTIGGMVNTWPVESSGDLSQLYPEPLHLQLPPAQTPLVSDAHNRS
jgi:hypothetical protein